MNTKYKFTGETKEYFGIILYQIEALKDFSNVSKGDKGGWIEKEENLSVEDNAWVSGDAQVFGDAQVSGSAQVSGDAQVFGDARVSGSAWVSAKSNFTKGWFIGGDDSGKITAITSETGSSYWNKQYVLGDYEITPIVEDAGKEVSTDDIIEFNGVKYKKIK